MKRLLPFLFVLLPVAALHLAGGFEFLERKRMDLQFRLAERQARSDIVVVEIDPRSLHHLGVWPWPRGYHATVLEQLFEAGARRVGVDIDFSSRSIAGEDAELTKALAASGGRVVLPIFRRWQQDEPDERHLTVVEPLPRFAQHAVLASINVRPDSDGLVRRYDNRAHFSTGDAPAFATALTGEPRSDLESFYIDFSVSPRSIPRIAYVDVLTGQFDRDRVAGKTVVIGPTAVELGDYTAVPVSAALPGTLVQALAYDSLVRGRALRRLGPALTLVTALILGLLLAPRLESMSWRSGVLLAVTLVQGMLLLTAAVEQCLPVLLDVVPLVFTIVGLYGFALVKRIDEQALGLLTQRVAMRRTETLMHHVVQSSFDAIVTIDENGRVRTFNRAAEIMFGLSETEVAGRPVTQLVHPAGPNSLDDLLARASGCPVEAVGRSRDGGNFPVELVVTPIESEDAPKLVAVLRDITERKAHEEELRHQATHDPLTDLPNRFLLVERIALELHCRPDARLAVLLLDVDRFKEINDALGHSAGDLLLQNVARRLDGVLKQTDTLARLGGDEFAVLLPGATAAEARQTARMLLDVLKTPFNVDGFSLQIDASLGITLFPEHGDDAATLIQRADVAMYVAKAGRHGFAVYDREQDSNFVRQLTLRGDLRGAIENDRLSLAYQPKVLAKTDRIVGVEALLRWQHPEHGFIPPDEFIGLAEQTGLIRPLTRWVLSSALGQASVWRRRGLPLRVSVNLSARNLLEEDLPSAVQRMLTEHGVPPEDLMLEITESVMMEDPERALATVRRLRQLGVGIAVDDFGTGYSSLTYLMRLPAQELKIDKSFVMQMELDPDCETIVHSIIELGHNLGLAVVAEGVESETIWGALKQLGCDIGQGYYFSRPVPPDRLIELVRASLQPAEEVAWPLGAEQACSPAGPAARVTREHPD